MSRTRKLPNEARSAILEILQRHPNGLEHSELLMQLRQRFPNRSTNTLRWYLHEVSKDEKVEKPARGLYRLADLHTPQPDDTADSPRRQPREHQFYEAFASFLVDELDECTRAIPLGGKCFGDKWGTPDVIGVYKLPDNVPIKAPMEIVSAEIKVDSSQVVTAFGQACAYTVFSHKVYLVLPEKTPRDELQKVENLCMRFGIGLIVFNSENYEEPNFTIRVRASRHEPDYFYLNMYFRKCDEKLNDLFR